MKEAGVLPNMAMILGQMNELPGARFRVGHAARAMAEYFRADEHKDVLLLIDFQRFINKKLRHDEPEGNKKMESKTMIEKLIGG